MKNQLVEKRQIKQKQIEGSLKTSDSGSKNPSNFFSNTHRQLKSQKSFNYKLNTERNHTSPLNLLQHELNLNLNGNSTNQELKNRKIGNYQNITLNTKSNKQLSNTNIDAIQDLQVSSSNDITKYHYKFGYLTNTHKASQKTIGQNNFFTKTQRESDKSLPIITNGIESQNSVTSNINNYYNTANTTGNTFNNSISSNSNQILSKSKSNFDNLISDPIKKNLLNNQSSNTIANQGQSPSNLQSSRKNFNKIIKQSFTQNLFQSSQAHGKIQNTETHTNSGYFKSRQEPQSSRNYSYNYDLGHKPLEAGSQQNASKISQPIHPNQQFSMTNISPKSKKPQFFEDKQNKKMDSAVSPTQHQQQQQYYQYTNLQQSQLCQQQQQQHQQQQQQPSQSIRSLQTLPEQLSEFRAQNFQQQISQQPTQNLDQVQPLQSEEYVPQQQSQEQQQQQFQQQQQQYQQQQLQQQQQQWQQEDGTESQRKNSQSDQNSQIKQIIMSDLVFEDPPKFNMKCIKDEIEEERLPINQLPYIEPSKVSNKNVGIISSYGANTHQGLVRNYNEDRVSIILNIIRPPNKINAKNWPVCSYFAIYDGHGGANCAEFLRDNLHQYIVKENTFPDNPYQAIVDGFQKAEQYWLEKADKSATIDRSGSCVIALLLVDNVAYSINLGDSRAILSINHGKIAKPLSEDHKPNNPTEEKRITEHGGKIYSSQVPYFQDNNKGITYIQGPARVLPGKLAVSRTMGDIESKFGKYGGMPNVISAVPEIMTFKIEDDHDFILLGCDGIFDKLENEECIDLVWRHEKQHKGIHQFIGASIEGLMKESLQRRSYDNVTVVIVGLKNLEKIFSKKPSQYTQQNSNNQ